MQSTVNEDVSGPKETEGNSAIRNEEKKGMDIKII
jgi:hypothetical protein